MLIAHGEVSCGVTTNSKHHHPCSRIKNTHGKDEGTNPPSKGEKEKKREYIKGERERVCNDNPQV